MPVMPLGIQRFRRLRQHETAHFYVDKTRLIHDMTQMGRYFLLCRPPRFGKSLLLSTLEALFSGEASLFDGLWIADHWPWQRCHPVIHLDLAAGPYPDSDTLEQVLRRQLEHIARTAGYTLPAHSTAAETLDLLIPWLARRHRAPVVILIDEYDRPLREHLKQPARLPAMKRHLQQLMGTIHRNDSMVRLFFATATTRWAPQILFSETTRLIDLSLDTHFDTLCGFTVEELRQHPHLDLSESELALLAQWYGGYRFPETNVLNPFDVLSMLHNDGRLDTYWWEYAQPDLWLRLANLTPDHFLPAILVTEVSRGLLELSHSQPQEPALMLWQAGLLAIRESRFLRNHQLHTLGLPNLAIQTALGDHILDSWFQLGTRKEPVLDQLHQQLYHHHLHHFERTLWHFLAQYEQPLDRARAGTLFFALMAACGGELRLQAMPAPEAMTFTLTLNGHRYRFHYSDQTRAEPALTALCHTAAQGETCIAVHFDIDMGNIAEMHWQQM